MSSDSGSTLGNDQHRTCMQCGADCPPEPFKAGGVVRIAFVCAEHGVNSVADLFEGER